MWTSFFLTVKSMLKKYKMLKFLALCMILGSIFGSLTVNIFIDSNKVSFFSNLISTFLNNYKESISGSNYSFFYCFLNNSKFLIIIWVLGFTKLGVLFIFLILILKGLFYGFTMAFFIIQFGIIGIFYACLFYLIQNIILIPCYFYVSINACSYCLRKLYQYKNASNIRKYLKILIVVLILCAVISLFDIYIGPKIANLFI